MSTVNWAYDEDKLQKAKRTTKQQLYIFFMGMGLIVRTKVRNIFIESECYSDLIKNDFHHKRPPIPFKDAVKECEGQKKSFTITSEGFSEYDFLLLPYQSPDNIFVI